MTIWLKEDDKKNVQNLGTCPKEGGGGLAHSQVQTWEHFVRGEGVWQNVPNPRLKICFIMTPKRLNYPLICVKTTIL